jgi:hypothetical protein
MPSSCNQAIVVPSLGAAIRLLSSGESLESVADSVRILPEGWTTVPFPQRLSLDKRIAELEAAGLEVETVEDPDARPDPWRFLGTDPAAGSPIERGGTVTVSVAGHVR